ncbi:TPA: LOW QUALITY PROTEIN: hypothetical protein N0F65_001514 [Lagenidium giganteum]|uniref:TIR domain-containing protein n=1 Tax=Lagenidium giganteum TaxID=4803 RepID=A0AAV2Z435_9STRA|nr:TPA: LOW QUALITY PROTEIN: hypothetical protein N0F65_001514 [Lagenidium giganteum]
MPRSDDSDSDSDDGLPHSLTNVPVLGELPSDALGRRTGWSPRQMHMSTFDAAPDLLGGPFAFSGDFTRVAMATPSNREPLTVTVDSGSKHESPMVGPAQGFNLSPLRQTSTGELERDASVLMQKTTKGGRPAKPPMLTRAMACLCPQVSMRARLLRWYGRVRNSYFAFWLVVCSLIVTVLEVFALIIAKRAQALIEKDRHELEAAVSYCGDVVLPMEATFVFASPNILLLLPVVYPSKTLQLFQVRDKRLVRRPYLQVCEAIVITQVCYILYAACFILLRLPSIISCHKEYSWATFSIMYSQLVVVLVIWWQNTVFCRFLSHLKLQTDCWHDNTHTSSLSDRTRKMLATPCRSAKSRAKHEFRKQVYRAVAREDYTETERLLTQALNDHGVEWLRNLYKEPTLWLYAFAKSKKNPLHIAAMRGNLPIVKLLVERGELDPNALDKVWRVNLNLGLLFKICTRLLIRTQDASGSPLRSLLCTVLVPPLYTAVAAGHVHVVKYLIKKQADVNKLSRASFYDSSSVVPPIFMADDPQVLRLLMTKGANYLHVVRTLSDGDTTMVTPLQRAAFTMRTALTEHLLVCGGDVALTPLHEAAGRDDGRRVKAILSRGVHVDTLGERVEGVHKRTPLHWAAIIGAKTAAQILLDHGANPNAVDRKGRTPLHWAARNNHVEVVQLLLQRGAKADAVDDDDYPVVCFAAEAERNSVSTGSKLFGLLVKKGAALDARVPETMDTPLHIALQHENRKTALALIKCGANMMVTNSAGKRAVDCTTSTKFQFDMKKEAGSRDVMISYTHTHFEFAQLVRNHIESTHKLTCWMDTMDPSGIGGGAVWREEIARGIHNCSLVVSIICDGYWKSEWCMKELALAKLIRKPAIALVVEGTTNMTILDSLIPAAKRFTFNDFIKGRRTEGRKVLFDVDEAKFEARMTTIMPLLRSTMQAERHVEDEKKSDVTPTPSVTMETLDEELVRPTLPAPPSEAKKHRPNVLICSSATTSSVGERILRDVGRFGYKGHFFTAASPMEDILKCLDGCRFIVALFEPETPPPVSTTSTISTTSTSDTPPGLPSAVLTEVLREAKGRVPSKRVLPRNLLDYSKMYSLSRSELFYVVEGVGVARSVERVTSQIHQIINAIRNSTV